MPLTKAITLDFLKRFFGISRTRSLTARTLSSVILRSLRLFPVAIAAQIIGMGSLVLMYWETEYSRVFLIGWTVIWLAQVIVALVFVRKFWRDDARVKNVRAWVRRWTVLAVVTGSIWGLTGILFVVQGSGLLQVMTVAITVAVTFAGWPVYSCWMPSLTAFTLLSMTPLTMAVAGQYRVSSVILTTVLVVVTGFILYSGRKLNELITSSVLADAENTRLVERLRIEVQRSENARRATQKESERRARFFAAANHDLRQPLQAMGIYLDILKRKCTPATKPVVDQLALTSASISTLVEQVLEVTRMEFGGQEPHIERMELAPLFSRLEAEFGPAAKVKGLLFRTVPTNVAVDADPVMLERALKNLVANAINYSNPKNPRPEVVVAARRLMVKGKRFVRIGVYDCGDGMTKEERGKIFDAFFRGEAGKRRPGSGFGLGEDLFNVACEGDFVLAVELVPHAHVLEYLFRVLAHGDVGVAERDELHLVGGYVVEAGDSGRVVALRDDEDDFVRNDVEARAGHDVRIVYLIHLLLSRRDEDVALRALLYLRFQRSARIKVVDDADVGRDLLVHLRDLRHRLVHRGGRKNGKLRRGEGRSRRDEQRAGQRKE